MLTSASREESDREPVRMALYNSEVKQVVSFAAASPPPPNSNEGLKSDQCFVLISMPNSISKRRNYGCLAM